VRRASRERPTYHLRLAVERLPRHTKEAMLRGIAANRIIVGAYVDPRSGGICPMLAAHRNGGRTSVASFARAWDAFTGAKRPRRATRHEVGTLRSLLEWSLGVEDGLPTGSIAEAAAQIRAEREQLRCAGTIAPAAEPPAASAPTAADADVPPLELPDPGPAEVRILRRPAWLRAREARMDVLAAAEAQLATHGERSD
jgi:hypothetical protein